MATVGSRVTEGPHEHPVVAYCPEPGHHTPERGCIPYSRATVDDHVYLDGELRAQCSRTAEASPPVSAASTSLAPLSASDWGVQPIPIADFAHSASDGIDAQ